MAPNQNDPRAWNAWAQTQDPGLYGWQDGAWGPGSIAELAPVLAAEDLWDPSWGDPNTVGRAQGFGGEDAAQQADDAVAHIARALTERGYTPRGARSSGSNFLNAVFDANGKQIGQSTIGQNQGSMKGKDWATAAAVVGAGMGAGAALGSAGVGTGLGTGVGAGAGAGAGAGGALTAEQTAMLAANAPVGNAGALGAWEAAQVAGSAVAGGTTAGGGSTGALASSAPGTSLTQTGALTPMGQIAAPAALPAAATPTAVVGGGLTTSDWLGIATTAYGMTNGPKAADTSGINQAALDSSQLGRDSFDWFKAEFERTAPQRDAAAVRDGKIADAQLEGMNFATAEARALAERNRAVFQPLEDKIVAGAQAYDTPERRAQAVAEATADIEGAVGRAQQSNQRAIMRTGATTSGPAAQAMMQDASLAKAKMVAGATGAATRNVEQQGYARKMDAASLGRGLPSNQATQQQIATNTGSASVNSGAGAINAAQAGTGIMQTGFNTAQQGINTAGSLFGQAANIDTSTRGQDLNFLGNAFNAYIKKSDRRAKMKTGKITDGRKELAQVMATPVHADWTYRPDSGYDDGQEHTGPMAQQVRAKMGETVAPGGTDIDMRQMGGKLIAAIQAQGREIAGIKRTFARMGSSAKKSLGTAT